MRIHLDTDFAGDTDDACALVHLLGSPDVEVTGITTSIDSGGRRAGCVAHFLKLAGREDIPVASGAAASLTSLQRFPDTADDERYWPEPVAARPSAPGAAAGLLAASIERGATIVAIGPYTNLALLEVERPGSLARVPVVVMGGWFRPSDAGLPPWGANMDFNVQCDTSAARVVASAADVTWVTLPATLKAHLRGAHLPRLRESGPIGRLLARQAEVHGEVYGMPGLGRAHTGLPDDLLNFQYDPVACATAIGWPGVSPEDVKLRAVLQDGVVRLEQDESGRAARVVVDVDGDAFEQEWLSAAERADAATS